MSADEGFLARWARRKALARAGAALPPEPTRAARGAPDATAASAGSAPVSAELPTHMSTRETAGVGPTPRVPVDGTPGAGTTVSGERSPSQAASTSAAPAPVPTLEEVERLTPQSDFARFVRPEVPTPVRNAALRKLFADPHFNVMDGLDVYIDDYTRPDPLPTALARQMVAAQFMRLFDAPAAQPAAMTEAAAASPPTDGNEPRPLAMGATAPSKPEEAAVTDGDRAGVPAGHAASAETATDGTEPEQAAAANACGATPERAAVAGHPSSSVVVPAPASPAGRASATA